MGHVLWPLYDGKVGLSLLAGPANAGKVALLLERYLARLDDEPVLIVPNASDVDRVERDLLARHGCLFSGEIVTFDRLFELLVRDDPDRRPVATDHAARADRPARGRRRHAERADRLRAHERLRRRAAADARRARVRACSTRRDLDGDLARLYEGYRAELDRLGALGSRPAAPPRRRASPVRSRRVARRARLRVRVRGPDERASGRCSRRSRGAPTCEVSLPYEPGRVGVRVAAAHRRRSRRRSRPGASRSCRRARPSTRIRRSRTSSARSSRESPPAPPEIDGAVRFFEGAGRAARSSSSARRSSACSARARRPSRSRSSRRRSTAGARRSRPCSAASASRTRSSRACASATTPLGHALLQLLRYAWTDATAARAVRVPPLAVLGPRALVRRLRRGTPARTRDPQPGARRGGDREAARGAGSRARRAARRGVAARRARASLIRSMLRSRVRHRGAAGRRDVAARPARRTTRSLRLLDELEALTRLGESLAPEEVLAVARARRGAARFGVRGRPGRGARPDARTDAALRDRLRARARGGVAAAPLAHVAVPRRRRAPRARRAGSSAPTRSAATATSSTPRARARRAVSTSCARRRPTTARRASRARSGKRSRPSSTKRTSRARPRAGRCPRSRGRSRRRRPSVSALRALAQLAVDEARRGARARRRERLGRAGSRAHARRSAATHASRNDALLSWLGSKTTFGVTELERFADCSSAWLFERIVSPKTIDAESSTRCCAARSRTARCTSSTPGCRRSSGTIASRRRTSSVRSGSSAAASTTRCAAASASS